jgi:hypothetical protein
VKGRRVLLSRGSLVAVLEGGHRASDQRRLYGEDGEAAVLVCWRCRASVMSTRAVVAARTRSGSSGPRRAAVERRRLPVSSGRGAVLYGCVCGLPFCRRCPSTCRPSGPGRDFLPVIGVFPRVGGGRSSSPGVAMYLLCHGVTSRSLFGVCGYCCGGGDILLHC